MDFKSLTWAGNIYQKFEAMCLEVEEVMYEDTVKYVENQAQKVGGSVKRFYSEVMLDLVSLSCVDSVKVAESNKPKLVTFEELRKKEAKKSDIYDLAEEKPSSRFCNDANHVSPSSDVGSTKSRKVATYKRPIGIKRISRNINHPEVTCHVTSLSRDTCVSRDATGSRLMATDDTSVTSSSEFSVTHHPVEAVNVNTSISDASDKILLSESVISRNINPPEVTCHVTSLSQDTTGSRLMASDDTSVTSSSEFSVRHHPLEAINVDTSISDASEKILLSESIMQEKLDCDYVVLMQKKNGSQCPSSSYHGSTTKPIDKFKNDGSLNIGSNACDDDSAIEEVISCYEDNFDMEIIDNEEAVDPRVANLEAVENSNLEETCILVHSVSQGTENHKSYKKKIREALSSKPISAKKVIPRQTVEQDKTKFPVHDSFESDWELL